MTTRSLPHVAADWPGHFPNGPVTAAVLTAAGADVDARVAGPHTETPLHWAASSDDVDVLDVLIDVGASIEAPGASDRRRYPARRRGRLWAVAGRPPAGRTRGPHRAVARGRARPHGPCRGPLRRIPASRTPPVGRRKRHATRRVDRRLLVRLPRRPADGSPVLARARRSPQLDLRVGRPHTPRRRSPRRPRRAGHLAARTGCQVGQRIDLHGSAHQTGPRRRNLLGPCRGLRTYAPLMTV